LRVVKRERGIRREKMLKLNPSHFPLLCPVFFNIVFSMLFGFLSSHKLSFLRHWKRTFCETPSRVKTSRNWVFLSCNIRVCTVISFCLHEAILCNGGRGQNSAGFKCGQLCTGLHINVQLLSHYVEGQKRSLLHPTTPTITNVAGFGSRPGRNSSWWTTLLWEQSVCCWRLFLGQGHCCCLPEWQLWQLWDLLSSVRPEKLPAHSTI